ncbi:hypothetical protein ACTXT7_014255 [Hymenolepis weldensis]
MKKKWGSCQMKCVTIIAQTGTTNKVCNHEQVLCAKGGRTYKTYEQEVGILDSIIQFLDRNKSKNDKVGKDVVSEVKFLVNEAVI